MPFKTRLEYAKRGFITSNDKIVLYGVNETLYWTELDHWDYSDLDQPSPPDYSFYTLFSLQTIIIAAIALTAVQFILIALAKIMTSVEFRMTGDLVNKLIHVLENLNYATPFYDWDEGCYTVQEFRARLKATIREMAATLCINILCTMAMLTPLWYTGKISFACARKRNLNC